MMIDARSRLQIGSETLACEFEDFRVRTVCRHIAQPATLFYRLVFGDTPKAEQRSDRQQEHRSMTIKQPFARPSISARGGRYGCS